MKRFLVGPIAGVVLAGVLLTLVLGWMVVDRMRLLSSGREIEVAVRPVDPRDLFKGDYVALGYDISRLDASLLVKDQIGPGKGPARTVYVTLAQQADQSWKPVAVSVSFPKSVGADQVVLRGASDRYLPRNVRYGIERYYLPEGTGRRVEDIARHGKLAVILAVDSGGRAAIKGLVENGKRIYEEPLF